MVTIDFNLWADLHISLCRLAVLEDELERYDSGDDAMKILDRLEEARKQSPTFNCRG